MWKMRSGSVTRSRRLEVEKISMDALCLKLHDLGFDLKKKMGDLNPKMSEAERERQEKGGRERFTLWLQFHD